MVLRRRRRWRARSLRRTTCLIRFRQFGVAWTTRIFRRGSDNPRKLCKAGSVQSAQEQRGLHAQAVPVCASGKVKVGGAVREMERRAVVVAHTPWDRSGRFAPPGITNCDTVWIDMKKGSTQVVPCHVFPQNRHVGRVSQTTKKQTNKKC